MLQDGFLQVYLRRRIRVYQRNYGFFCQILRVDSNSYIKSLLLQKPRCLLYLEKRLICLMIKTKINCEYLVISVFDLAAWSIHVRFNRWEYHFWKLMFGTCFYSQSLAFLPCFVVRTKSRKNGRENASSSLFRWLGTNIWYPLTSAI